jgi:hypothetical protein
MSCAACLTTAIFLKKIASGTHSDPKFGRRGGVSYIDVRKSVPERRPGLRPS